MSEIDDKIEQIVGELYFMDWQASDIQKETLKTVDLTIRNSAAIKALIRKEQTKELEIVRRSYNTMGETDFEDWFITHIEELSKEQPHE